MRLKRLVLDNVCQFQHTELNFLPGLTGIFGQNGSGKSNSMKMAYATLTNDWTRNPFTKEEHIRDTANEKAVSSVYAEWEHVTNFSITRGLRPDKHEMLIGNERLISAKSIQRRVEGLIGLSRQVLDNYVFVPQSQLADFVSASPSKRAEVFAHLCRTIITEKILKEVGDTLRRDMPLAVTVVDNSDELQQRIGDAKQRKTVLLKGLSQQQKQALTDKQLQICEQQIKKYDRLVREEDELEKVRSKHQLIEVKLSQAQEKLATAKRDAETLGMLVLGLEPGFRAAQEAVARGDLLIQQAKRRTELVELTADVPQAPRVPESYEKQAEYQQALAKCEAELTRAQQSLEFFADSSLVNCPTCGTPVAELEYQVEELQLLAKNLPAEISLYQYKLALYRKYEQAKHVYDGAMVRHKVLLEELASIPPVDPAELDIAAHEKVINTYRRRSEELKAVRQALSLLEQDVVAARTERTALAERRQELSRSVRANQIAQEDYERARKLQRQNSQARQEVAVLQAKVEAEDQILVQSAQSLQRIAVVKQRAASARSWVDYLETAKNVLHYSQLPRVVAEGYMAELAERTNDNLADFRSPFLVRPGADLGFIFKKGRGKERGAEALSGGELAVLAMSFRIAVNQIFARDIDMMVLDEPTAGLDEDNMDCLEYALRRLAELSASRGHQVILITHERALERVLDQTIRL